MEYDPLIKKLADCIILLGKQRLTAGKDPNLHLAIHNVALSINERITEVVTAMPLADQIGEGYSIAQPEKCDPGANTEAKLWECHGCGKMISQLPCPYCSACGATLIGEEF